MTKAALDTRGIRLNFGKYVGELITRVPVGYLLWIVNNDAPMVDYASAELERRGTTFPKIGISGHAVDRASLRLFWKHYLPTRKSGEGLNSWLIRTSEQALSKGSRNGSKITYKGLIYVFSTDTKWPVLMSIMLRNGGVRRKPGPRKDHDRQDAGHQQTERNRNIK